MVPATRPWSAPEWHHRGFRVDDAKKTDVYSFGLLCLWLFLQGEESFVFREDLRGPSFSSIKDWKAEEVESMKADNSILDVLIPSMVTLDSSDSQITSCLREIFHRTLQHNAARRSPDLLDIIAILNTSQDVFNKSTEGLDWCL